MKPLLSLGNRLTLVDDDLGDISDKDKCFFLLNRAHYDGNRWQGTWNLIKRVFLKDFLLVSWLMLVYGATRIAQPLLIREIILCINDTSKFPTYTGYLFAIGLGICSFLQNIFHPQIYFRNTRIGMRLRKTLSCIIYKHLLMINTASLYKTTAAQMINLVANDASKFEEMATYCQMLWFAPLEAAIMFGLIWRHIGLATLFSYTMLILFIPMQLVFSKLFSRFRTTTMAYTDKRVQTFNEIINGCQIIKMYNWEKAMEHLVRLTRRSELRSIYRASFLRAVNFGFSFASLSLISLAAFGGSWLLGKQLTAVDIFTSMSFFALLDTQINGVLPLSIEKISEARVAARRIDEFLKFKILQRGQEKQEQENKEHAIIMTDASFSWIDDPCLLNLDLKIPYGKLIGVKGAIASGKSSLLAAILGEINLVNGTIQRNVHSISYAPQIPWIFADTIQNNILFGKSMDEERYNNVIKACCLDVDLSNFGKIGDLMMIGDKGVNLSGGQKARISLARALYADADLYLLDDPLAAVDPKVAEKVFDQCIGPRSLLREKTRILVTHQTHFLDDADQTILLTNGHLDEIHNEKYFEDEQSNKTTEVDSSENNDGDNGSHFKIKNAIADVDSIVKDEISSDGSIKWKVWLQFLTSPPLRWFGLFLGIILILTTEALSDYTNYWLSSWSAKSESNQASSLDAYVYLGLTISTLIAALVRAIFLFYIMLRGSNYFHHRMLSGIVNTSLRFFESSPIGRILNRVSKDQQVIDESLPLTLFDTIQNLVLTLGSIVLIGTINPWVLLILVPLTPVFLWLRRFYVRSSRQLKRLESVTRSPIYAFFSSSLDGLTIIRAFQVQDDLLDMFMEKLDANSRAYFVLLAAARWFSFQLSNMVSLLTLVTAILAIALRHQLSPSAAALSIAYCIRLADIFQWAVRQSAEAENYMTSSERIHEYGQLAPESHETNSKCSVLLQPPDDWPSRGIIEFKDYTLRYRPQLNPVLKNLNLRIESREKIGIIGRTGRIFRKNSNAISIQTFVFLYLGAGKSSLLQGLFRLVDQSSITGSILIDGIDIGCVSLDQLRSRLSIIPQVPVLFCGTLRYNIDPFTQYSDEECLQALEAVQLKQLVCNHPDGLQQQIAESGTNLSAGERQLICVARAILKKSHILFLDEATASVDHFTDSMIQKVIAEKFRDRTVLTIAHRLNTIDNSDRILMLQQGEVAFFDIPSNVNLI